jgi:hypothetical protein
VFSARASAPLVGALVLLAASQASAQVNVEPIRQQVTQKKFGGRIGAAVTSYAGNTQGVIFGGSALMGGRTERNFGFLNTSGDYARLGGSVSVAKWFAHLRHNFQLSEWVWWEEYAQIESDRFRRVQLRELVGTGPRFKLFGSELLELYVATSYMVEHAQLSSNEFDPHAERAYERWSSYIAATFRPDERIQFSTVNYVQPAVKEFSDYKVLSVSSIDFKVLENLTSRIAATARYESLTPADVRHADLELKSSLEVKF